MPKFNPQFEICRGQKLNSVDVRGEAFGKQLGFKLLGGTGFLQEGRDTGMHVPVPCHLLRTALRFCQKQPSPDSVSRPYTSRIN